MPGGTPATALGTSAPPIAPCIRVLAALLLTLHSAAHAETLLIDASRMELEGGWNREEQKGDNVRKLLVAGPNARNNPAAAGVQIAHAGKWRLWVRSKDFPQDRPGSRNYSVRLGNARSTKLFGQHGQAALDGWAWEDGGTLELPAGPNLLVLGDTVASSARCDAILLTDNQAYQPEGVPWKLNKQPATMVPLTFAPDWAKDFTASPMQQVEKTAAATLQNERLRLAFLPAQTASGKAIALRVESRDAQGWRALASPVGTESYRVLFRPETTAVRTPSHSLHPRWDSRYGPVVEAGCGGVSIKTLLGIETAPWSSGQVFAQRPTAARQVDPRTVELTFAPTKAGQLTATWSLAEQDGAAKVALHFTPAQPGQYSLGFHGPCAVPPQETDFMLLPFQYTAHRFPEQPAMMLSALTPTPMALVNQGGLSCSVVAEPTTISFTWPAGGKSPYMLGLRNEAGLAQPLLYGPVFGEAGSLSQGEPIECRFRLSVQAGDWYAGYRQVAEEIYGLRDYRRPTTASLSDAALNLYDYLRDEKASGWNAKAKGPWNIESRNTVSQSFPLTYLSLYLLTGDEDFYHRFARPSLEYLLSRPTPHFAAEQQIWNNYYTHRPMAGPSPFFGASTFASAYAMTHGRTAAFGELCLDEKGGARRSHPNGHTHHFGDSLALYKMTGEKRWLQQAIQEGDQYIAARLNKLPDKDLGPIPFVNVSFVPDWEGLLHLYEASGEQRFLTASQEGARWLTTSLWTQPLIPAGDTTIHPGGAYDHNRHIWWWGDRLFRRGIYDGPAEKYETSMPTAAPVLGEKKVPAWQVSNVGLGLEQPVTYNRPTIKGNILMNVWAASMLRVAALAQEPALRTAARNGFIGRFANYPGYYLDGMTTEYMRPDYPQKGPDVTTMYVHHAPPFTAGVLDYLFTDAEMRTQGAVRFPSVRQSGYVWFDSRLYGHAPGKVYGQLAWPWLHRTAATVDTSNVDRVLAEGEGKFFVTLLNQVPEAQKMRVTFDPKALGRELEGAEVSVLLDGQVAPPRKIENGAVELNLTGLGHATLTLAGVKINVPTHRLRPPEHLPLPTPKGLERKAVTGTSLHATAAILEVPPFTWRDLYVSVDASISDCKGGKLIYRVADAPEQTVTASSFPLEWTARLPTGQQPITWRVELEMADGQAQHTSAR